MIESIILGMNEKAMHKEEIFDKMITIIEEHEDLEPLLPIEDLRFESELKEDIGFDSIALMSLVYELQELYPNFDGTSIYKWNTLGDIIDDLSKFL
jgi:acyl carrier protein